MQLILDGAEDFGLVPYRERRRRTGLVEDASNACLAGQIPLALVEPETRERCSQSLDNRSSSLHGGAGPVLLMPQTACGDC